MLQNLVITKFEENTRFEFILILIALVKNEKYSSLKKTSNKCKMNSFTILLVF